MNKITAIPSTRGIVQLVKGSNSYGPTLTLLVNGEERGKWSRYLTGRRAFTFTDLTGAAPERLPGTTFYYCVGSLAEAVADTMANIDRMILPTKAEAEAVVAEKAAQRAEKEAGIAAANAARNAARLAKTKEMLAQVPEFAALAETLDGDKLTTLEQIISAAYLQA